MSKIALSPHASGTGVFTIQSPNSNTDRTLVLPDEAGTVLTSASNLAGVNGVPTVGPAFRVTMSASQTVSHGAWARVNFDSVIFDSDSCYSTANKEFNPNVAGWYWIGTHVQYSGTTFSRILIDLTHSTTGYGNERIVDHQLTSAYMQSGIQFSGSALMYFNGTTDKVSVTTYQLVPSGTPSVVPSDGVYFSGFFVRGS